MARSRGVLAPIALLVLACCVLLPRLLAFVSPSAAPRPVLRRRVALAATTADVAAAKENFELKAWAAASLVKQGAPQAAAAQARAQQAEQAYLSLKAAAEGAAPPAPAMAAAPAVSAAPAVAAAPVAYATPAGVPVKEEVAEAKAKAELIAWAAKTLQKKGSPQAAEMQARADRKLHEYESLRAAFENGAPAAPAAMPAASAAVPVAAPVPVAGVPTKEELASAKAKADLLKWAAKTLVETGAPQAAAMQAKADAKAQIYTSLKAAYEQGAPASAPIAAAPAAAAPAMAPAAAAPAAVSGQVPTPAELEKFKQEVELMAWAAKALAAKGAPQAADMQARAQKKAQTYETLKELAKKAEPMAAR